MLFFLVVIVLEYLKIVQENNDRITQIKENASKNGRKISYEEFLQLNDDLKAFTIRSLDNDIQFVSVAPSDGVFFGPITFYYIYLFFN